MIHRALDSTVPHKRRRNIQQNNKIFASVVIMEKTID